jgi:hypothetical protein
VLTVLALLLGVAWVAVAGPAGAAVPAGTVAVWGGPFGGASPAPTNSSGITYTAISAGGGSNLALRSDGTLAAWGANQWGGIPGPPVNPAGVTFTAVAAGWTHSLALRSDATVAAWGSNDQGQSVVPASLAGTRVVAVASGDAHSLALRSDGTVVAWGWNNYGQSTVPAMLAGSRVVAISAGNSHSLALRSDGTIVGWGGLGFGTGTVLANPPGVTFTAVAAGTQHTLALRSDGTVVGWSSTGNQYGEVTVPRNASGVRYTAVSAGNRYSLALRSDGTVAAWGDSSYGKTAPPAGLYGVTALAAGADHGLAIGSLQQASTLTVAPAAGPYGGSVTVSATLSSAGAGVAGRRVSFSLRGVQLGSATTDDAGTASVSGVSLVGTDAGTYPDAVAATWNGDSAVGPSQGREVLTVSQSEQSIGFDVLPDVVFGQAPFAVTATGGDSGNDVSFAATGTACSVDGATVTVEHAGSCSVTATQAGGGNYAPAPAVTRTFAVTPAASRTTLTAARVAPNTALQVSDPLALTATVVPAASGTAPGRFSGSVRFTVRGRTVGTAAVSDTQPTATATALLDTGLLPAGRGTYPVTATFLPDADGQDYAGSTARLSRVVVAEGGTAGGGYDGSTRLASNAPATISGTARPTVTVSLSQSRAAFGTDTAHVDLAGSAVSVTYRLVRPDGTVAFTATRALANTVGGAGTAGIRLPGRSALPRGSYTTTLTLTSESVITAAPVSATLTVG